MRVRWIIFTLLVLALCAPMAARPASALAQAGGTTHVVQPGENLFRIALRYGTTWPVLAAYNGITNPNLIFVGQILLIPPAGTQPPPPVPTTAPAPQPTPIPGGTTYVVQPGDTLSRIALRFNTTVAALVQANNIVNPNLIYVGQVLRITGGHDLGEAPDPLQPGRRA